MKKPSVNYDLPLVSVIIPNYNHAKYLTERINSVLAQDYPNFEVIILDDKSTDNSVEIIDTYKNHKRISNIVINTENSGNTFHQWAKGIKLSKGEYIWIAESDDVADSCFISKLMDKLINTPNAIVAFCYSYMIDGNGNKLEYTWDKPNLYQKDGISEGDLFCIKRLVYGNSIYNASMSIFKKSNCAEISESYRKYRHCGDWLFWLEMCKQGKVIEIPERLNYFRQHKNKVSNRDVDMRFSEILALTEEVTKKLNLTPLQLSCLKCYVKKKFNKSKYPNKEELSLNYPHLLTPKITDHVVYNLDKLIHFTKLRK